MKKKLFALIAVIAVAVFCLTACGGGGGGKESKFEVGFFNVSVPSGWNAVTADDSFDDYEDTDTDPTTIYVIKGGKTQNDILSKPYVWINYYGPGGPQMWGSPKSHAESLYDDVKDIDDIKGENLTWHGVTADNSGYPTAILWTDKDDNGVQYQANIILENGDNKISLEDEDVLTILDSLEATNTEE